MTLLYCAARFFTHAVDQVFALERHAENQADHHQHDRQFDQVKPLCCFSYVVTPVTEFEMPTVCLPGVSVARLAATDPPSVLGYLMQTTCQNINKMLTFICSAFTGQLSPSKLQNRRFWLASRPALLSAICQHCQGFRHQTAHRSTYNKGCQISLESLRLKLSILLVGCNSARNFPLLSC